MSLVPNYLTVIGAVVLRIAVVGYKWINTRFENK